MHDGNCCMCFSGLCEAYVTVRSQETSDRESGSKSPLGEGCGRKERTHARDTQQD